MASAQVGMMVLITMVGFIVYNVFIACSLLMGSLCSVIPSVYFAYRTLLYKFKVEGNPKKFLANLLYAEIVKFLLIGCMLIASFGFAKKLDLLSVTGVLIGFIITYLSVLFAPLMNRIIYKNN